jgi:rhomboid protease GluP
MATNATSWRISPGAACSAIRTTFFVISIGFALLLQLLLSSYPTGNRYFIYFASGVYVAVGLFLLRLYLKKKASVVFISASDEILRVPRALWDPYRVQFNEIKSIEKYCNSRESVAIIIGRYEKSSIIVERRSFFEGVEFDQFVGFLCAITSKNKPAEQAEDLEAVVGRRNTANELPTVFFIATLLLVYLFVSAPGIEEADAIAIAKGGLEKNAVGFSNVYRISSSFFLHVNPFHLGINILSLAILGRHIGILMGWIRFINILLTSAVVGALLSLRFSSFETVVGASGGVLGLFGAYIFACMKFQNEIPGSISASRRYVLIVLVLQIIFDVTSTGVDAFSHIGGLLSGLGYAALALRGPTLTRAANATVVEKIVAVAGLLFFGYGLSHFVSQYINL